MFTNIWQQESTTWYHPLDLSNNMNCHDIIYVYIQLQKSSQFWSKRPIENLPVISLLISRLVYIRILHTRLFWLGKPQISGRYYWKTCQSQAAGHRKDKWNSLVRKQRAAENMWENADNLVTLIAYEWSVNVLITTDIVAFLYLEYHVQ